MSLPDMALSKYLLNPTYVKDSENNDMMDQSGSKQSRGMSRRRRRRGREEKFTIPGTLRDTLAKMYNASQMEALEDCLKAGGITCIQGPPGTGKTTTIMGILSVILNAFANRRKTENSSDGRLILPGDLSQKIDPVDPVDPVDRRPANEIPPEVLKASAPWMFLEQFQPWYDLQVCSMEDVEDPTPLRQSRQENTYLDLFQTDESATPKRVLVCAPSNAAIDEIMRRLTADPTTGGGIFDGEGNRFNPSTIRVGPNCHPDLRKFSLQHRVHGRLQASATTSQQSEEFIKLALLEEAKVVCATLSVAGSKELSTFAGGFDTVVVDEASQGVELSTLVPLKLNCKRLILVGDPRQLPATVFSKIAMDLVCRYIDLNPHTHTYIHTYIHTYVHAYVHTYIHTQICRWVCTCIHTEYTYPQGSTSTYTK